MSDNDKRDKSTDEQLKSSNVAYVDEKGETQTREAEKPVETNDAEAPKPLGTDPAALGADGKEEYMTQKDAEKADGK